MIDRDQPCPSEVRGRTTAMQVFISHAGADQGLARELANRLAEAGYGTWTNEELFPGDNWALEMGKALERSEAMIVLVSPESTRSEQVNRDIQFAIGSLQYENRLIPVQVRKTAGVPRSLDRFQPIPGEGGAEEISRRVLERLQAAGEVAR
jgi:hypothetical protein